MVTRSLCLTVLIAFGSATVWGATKVILDTDMYSDYDDVGALATLHAFADEGKCELLAMATCTRGNRSVAAVEVINAFYGRENIPVGCSKEIGVDDSIKQKPQHNKYVRLTEKYKDWVKHQDSNDAPDSNEIYRKALATAPDKSVTFISIGFMTNMRRLLETKGDKYSPLDGKALVAKKVSRWFCMACKHPQGREYNVAGDAESAKIAFESWPTPIVFSDFNYGVDCYTGRKITEREYKYPNPIKDIFVDELPTRESCLQRKSMFNDAQGGHSSWDQVTVFAAITGIKSFFKVEPGTYQIVDATGNNIWVPNDKSKHCRLIVSEGKPRYNYPKWEIAGIIDELMMREPMCRRTDEAYLLHKSGKQCVGKTINNGLAARPVENIGRGLLAARTLRGTYLSWRLLNTDPIDIGFDVWRRVGGRKEKVNSEPITQTTDFLIEGYNDYSAEYSVDGVNFVPVSGSAYDGAVRVRYELADTNATISAIQIGDLDGDGEYDFVVKTPSGGNDPWDLVWKRREGTYKFEAYDSKGKFLWRKDLGVNIELGIWYSPYIVADLNGDGKAEVILKTAPLTPDYRGPDGRVQDGPEYLTVLNGLTGEEICKTPWIPRASPDHVGDYNHYSSRNQIALAYLDGKTPCIIMERGTYGKMIVEAYRLKDCKLELIWSFNNEFMGSSYRGQGDHACLCNDVDGDGFDEILIGSLTIDHDGTPLWCNGKGHSDAHYFGDIDPLRPGKELFFVYETRKPKGGGLTMTDPVTGKDIWALPVPTRHVHGCGMCADIAPEYPGLECYGQEVEQGGNSATNTHPRSDNRWFYTAQGQLVSSYTNCVYGYGNGVPTIFWDADLQKEILRGRIIDHEGQPLTTNLAPSSFVMDIYGDWREEFVSFEKGAFNIWSTDIPAMDRRVSLMQDPVYRSRICMETSGYHQPAILDYVPSAVSPNISLRIRRGIKELVLDISAPLDKSLNGDIKIELPEQWHLGSPPPTKVELAAGEHRQYVFKIKRPAYPRGHYDLKVVLSRDGQPPLIVQQPLVLK